MKPALILIVMAFPLLIFAGGPKVKSISASSTELSPGQTATITVQLKGKARDVKSMEFIVREFPYDVPPYVLKSVDEKKNRKWEAQIPVPYEAPVGTFHLELKVKMADGSELVSEETSGNSYGKAGTLVVSVL